MSLTGAAGGPGLTGPDARFSTFFPHRFLEGFLTVLASIWDDFFIDFGWMFWLARGVAKYLEAS